MLPGSDVTQLIARSIEVAHAHEHCDVEPAHVLLACTEDHEDIVSAELMAEGVDVPALRHILIAIPSAIGAGDHSLSRDEVDFPPLSAEHVQKLTKDLLAWRDAGERIRAAGGFSADEDVAELKAQRVSTSSAWFTLLNHHRYLAIAAARTYASRGHRLTYAYMLALHALQDSGEMYTAEDGDFSEFANRVIRNKLCDQLGSVTD